MKRTPRINDVKARALTDARPTFVSLVKGGANQRPFRAVKMEGAEPAPLENAEKESVMSDSIKANGLDIATLKFSSDVFADEAAVKAWLENGGYDEYTIETTEKGFTVNNTAVEFEIGSTKKIDGAKGVTVYTGKVAVEEASEKTEEEITAENAEVNTSEVQPVATKSEAASDDQAEIDAEPAVDAVDAVDAEKSETPIADEVADAEILADVSEAAAKEDEGYEGEAFAERLKGLYENSTLTSVLVSLSWLVEDAEYTGAGDEVVKQVKAAGKSLLKALAASSDETIVDLADRFKSYEAAKGIEGTALVEPVEEPVAEKSETPVEATPVATTEKSADAVEGDAEVAVKEEAPVSELAAAITAAMAPLADAMKGISDRLETVEGTTAKAEADTEERLKAVEQTSQTRKGADVSAIEDEAQPTDASVAKKADQRVQARRRLASALGHPDPTRV